MAAPASQLSFENVDGSRKYSAVGTQRTVPSLAAASNFPPSLQGSMRPSSNSEIVTVAPPGSEATTSFRRGPPTRVVALAAKKVAGGVRRCGIVAAATRKEEGEKRELTKCPH